MSPEESSPQQPKPKSFMIEVPDWSDRGPTQPDGIDVDLWKGEAEVLDPSKRLALMEQFLHDIEYLAAKGDIKNSQGEAYSVADIIRQLRDFAYELNNPEDGVDPFRFLPRSVELRESFKRLLGDEITGRPLMEALDGQNRDGLPMPQAIEKLGKGAFGAIGVVNPSEASSAPLGVAGPSGSEIKGSLFDNLPESVQSEILVLNTAKQNKAQSEREHNFSQAADDKREIGAIVDRLSPEAKAYLFVK